MNTIKCIHCGKDIEISEAIRHEIEEQIRDRVTKDVEEKLRSKVKEEYESKNEDIKKQLEEANKRNQELEKKKKEDEERIKEETLKEAAEKHRFEKLEYEKKISDMQKALEEAQRKGKQGSQQLQGEVLELDLEEQLKSQFPSDEFLPIPKGVAGGDIWQKVKDKREQVAGSIIWETKRTKGWDNKWLPKLREDARRINASEAILVTEVLPDGIKGFHRKDSVWISNYEYALHTARNVRFLILTVAAVKSSASHKDEELRAIYQYITSEAFKHKFEAHFEAVGALREDLAAEKRATEIRWKKREAQIDRIDRSSSQMYGELQGIAPELPDIKTLSLSSGGEKEE